MPDWIRRPAGSAAVPLATAPEIERAYEKGAHDAVARDKDLDAAYERGRRDARAERKRHPIIMALLFVLAAAGAVLIILAAVNGSFGDGGQVADQGLNTAAEQATPVVQEAVQDAGAAAREAGANVAESARNLGDKDASYTTPATTPADKQ